jgi:hypothetical protein
MAIHGHMTLALAPNRGPEREASAPPALLQHVLERRVGTHVGFSVGHRSLRFPFREAETTRGADYPSTEIEAAIRRGRGAVGATVGVEESEAGRDATFDAKRAAVQRAVMSSAVIA